MFWFGSYTDKHKHTMMASGFDDAVSSKRTDDKKAFVATSPGTIQWYTLKLFMDLVSIFFQKAKWLAKVKRELFIIKTG